MTKEQVIAMILDDKYYSVDDLRYNKNVGFLFSKDEFAEFLSLKDQLIDEEYDLIEKIPLKTFNSKHFFYTKGSYLLSAEEEYLRLLISDYELNNAFLFNRNVDDILMSKLFSEAEGSLNIENIPTTHKRIAEIHKSETVTDKNDVIVKNMLNAMKFIINDKPAFNKENMRKLYCILSKDGLPEELTLKPDSYYRHDDVYIADYKGADPDIIEECMDSLFAFANDENSRKKHGRLLPYICHYYILYVHPYFDYNGRTARMVSFWLNYIHKVTVAPYFMSEAINDNKNDYYRALTDTRNTNNDLTYFLGYILKTSIKYSLLYKNVEEMKKKLLKTGDTLTSTEWGYVKKILVHNHENYFNHKMFLTYIGASMSRQGAVKILNNLTRYNILEKSKNKKNETIYKINPDFVTYQYTG